MDFIFRADASTNIGTGHVARCYNLAKLLKNRGANVHFVCRSFEGNIIKKIRNDFGITTLNSSAVFKTIDQKNSDKIWPSTLQAQDASETIMTIKQNKPNWLILDHHGLDIVWERKMRSKIRNIMVIDDFLNRKHDCDIFLNQNFFKKENLKKEKLLPNHCKVLTGPKYALLDSIYNVYRKKLKPYPKKIDRVLVSFGGSDNENFTNKILEIFKKSELKSFKLDVVVGKNYKNKNILAKKIFNRSCTNLHLSPSNLAKLIYKANFSIGAGGITTWERLCLALPALIFSFSENQKIVCENLKKENLIYYINNLSKLSLHHLGNKIVSILKKRKDLSKKALNAPFYVDGFGTQRLAEVLYPSKKKDLKIRTVNQHDMQLYYHWVNEPLVRKNSFQSKKIKIKEHQKWFERKLKDRKSFLFVIEVNRLPVGQVRFEKINKRIMIDYSLDNIVRNRNWSKTMLILGIKKLIQSKSPLICAKVRTSNLSSISVFLSLGFKKKKIDKKKYFFFISAKNFLKKNHK